MLSNDLIYSASMLQDYQDCQRRFELKYIQHQSWPSIPAEPVLEFEALMTRGRQFHFFVHQYFSGIKIEAIQSSITGPDLQAWFQHFLDYIRTHSIVERHSEFRLLGKLDRHQLIAVYDLLVLTQDQSVIIFDWKTSLHQPKESRLFQKMQSVVYPFILFENLPHLFPAIQTDPIPTIQMIYWFPEFPKTPISFEYNQQSHLEHKHLLRELLNEITTKQPGAKFPLTENKTLCKYCQYRSLCDRGIFAGNLHAADDDLAAGAIEIDFNALPDLNPEV